MLQYTKQPWEVGPSSGPIWSSYAPFSEGKRQQQPPPPPPATYIQSPNPGPGVGSEPAHQPTLPMKSSGPALGEEAGGSSFPESPSSCLSRAWCGKAEPSARGEKPREAGRRGVCTQPRSTTLQDCSGSSHILSLPTRPACPSWGVAEPFSSGPQDGAIVPRRFCRGPGGGLRG